MSERESSVCQKCKNPTRACSCSKAKAPATSGSGRKWLAAVLGGALGLGIAADKGEASVPPSEPMSDFGHADAPTVERVKITHTPAAPETGRVEAEPSERFTTFDSLGITGDFLGGKPKDTSAINPNIMAFQNFEWVTDGMDGVTSEAKIETRGTYLGIHAENVSVAGSASGEFLVNVDISYEIVANEDGTSSLVGTNNRFELDKVLLTSDSSGGFAADKAKYAVHAYFTQQTMHTIVLAHNAAETSAAERAEGVEGGTAE